MSCLFERLLADERMDDLKKAISDRDYQQQLLQEYHINVDGESRARI